MWQFIEYLLGLFLHLSLITGPFWIYKFYGFEPACISIGISAIYYLAYIQFILRIEFDQ